MEESQNLSHSSSRHSVSIALIVSYLLLTLPASFFIGGFVALLFTTITTSNFEGANGYAWIGIFMLFAPLTFLSFLIALPMLIKKAPNILSTVIWILGCLTLFLVLYIFIII